MQEPVAVYSDLVGENSTTAGLYLIPAQYGWDDGWELSRDLIVEAEVSDGETVAKTGLSIDLTIEEYGIGDTLKDAVYDLLTSLSGYREALERRQDKLGDSAAADLASLKTLIRRKDSN